MTTDRSDPTVPHTATKPEPIHWLWKTRIPRREITLLSGETGAGKSTAIANIVARVTTGAGWPDGVGKAPVGDVLIIAEDTVASVQNPRLLAAGANLDHVRHWKDEFSVETDLAPLSHALSLHPKIKLVVIDPLVDCLRSTTYRGTRAALLALKDVAIKHDVAVVCAGHPCKGLPVPLDSFGGSRGITSVSRAFWQIVREDRRHLLLFVKGNCLDPDVPGLAFKVEPRATDANGKKVEARVVIWEAPVMLSAQDWWHVEKSKRAASEPKRSLIAATAFLREFLADGSKPAPDVLAAAAAKGIRRNTLFRGQQELGIIVRKETGRAHGGWVWELPAEPKLKSEPKSKRKAKDNVIIFPAVKKPAS
jgi:hypothetical protein